MNIKEGATILRQRVSQGGSFLVREALEIVDRGVEGVIDLAFDINCGEFEIKKWRRYTLFRKSEKSDKI